MVSNKVIVGVSSAALIAIGGTIWANHNRSSENATRHVEEVKRSTGVDVDQRNDINHNHNKLENHAERISALEAIIRGR